MSQRLNYIQALPITQYASVKKLLNFPGPELPLCNRRDFDGSSN